MLKNLFIIVIGSAIAGGAVAGVEWWMLDPPRPVLTGDPPPLPIIKKKPVRKWKWRLT